MKILHISDLHIGKKLNEYSLYNYQSQILTDIIDLLKSQNINVVVVTGDIYDKKIPSIESLTLFENFISTILNECDTKIILMTGNHDSYKRVSFGKDFFNEKLYIASEFNNELDTYILDDIKFYLFPFENYIQTRKKLLNDSLTSYNDVYKEILDDIHLDNTYTNIFCAHGYFSDISDDYCIDESVQRLSIGGTEMIDINLVSMFDIAMFGHLHQAIKVSNDHFRYSGTPLKYSFSEKNHVKSATLYNINDGKVSYELLPFTKYYDMVELTGTFEDLLLYEEDANVEVFYKINLTSNTSDLSISKLKNKFERILEFTFNNEQGTLRENKLSSVKMSSIYELFNDYYIDSTNEELDTNSKEYIESILEVLR